MEADIFELVQEGKALNSKLFSRPKILILKALEHLGEDGAIYRELKAALVLEDGILFSNLQMLEEMEYIKSNKITLQDKKMTRYLITSEGKEALEALRAWLKKI